jgi:hypothetical protein
MVHGMSFSMKTKGFSDLKDITGEVQGIVTKSGIRQDWLTYSCSVPPRLFHHRV